MFSAILLAALPLLHCAFAQTDDLSNVTMAFSTAMIVPDVIDSFDPTDILNITFTDSVTMEDILVVPGSLLTEEQTVMEPEFLLIIPSDSDMDNPANLSGSFVVIMVDPDAPTPQMPNVSQFLHFLGGDFTADSTGLLSNMSTALMEFFSPSPPDGSDPHRYVVLIFTQPDDFDMTGPMFINGTSPRTNFSVTDFAANTNLGDPVAGNFFFVGPSSNSSSSASASNSMTAPFVPITTSDSGSSSAPIAISTFAPFSTVSAPPLPSTPSTPSVPTASSPSRGVSMKIDRTVPAFALVMSGLIALAVCCF